MDYQEQKGYVDLKTLPKKIIRMDDGVEFVLNESTQLYRIHLGIPHLDDPSHLHLEYSYERLMEDPRSQGLFKVADGTENIPAMKKAWFDRVNAESAAFKGCGYE